MFTSSSSLPALVLTMLEALEVTDGDRVLEIGTGSGYNAVLLCERLGSDRVTSVDIDPELVELARERLAANGYTPALAAVDGAAIPRGRRMTGSSRLVRPAQRATSLVAVSRPTRWLTTTAASMMEPPTTSRRPARLSNVSMRRARLRVSSTP